MANKIFKNLDEQVEILRNKGLVIKDDNYTKEVLLRENYFFVSGYRHFFIDSNNVTNKSKNFLPGTTFDELYGVFNFDRRMRNIMFKNILIIENNIKSIISYQLSKKYGFKDKDYLNPKNFTTDPMKSRQVNDVLDKMKRQIRVNGRKHSATLHYMSNYGYIPMWILVKVLSFGIVSEMFSILKSEDQKEICKVYNIDVDEFITYLPILANYRNLCAHEDILFENRTQRELDDTIYHKMLGISKMDGEYIYGKNDIFALIIIIKQLIKPNEFKNLVEEIDHALNNLEYNLKTITIVKVLDRMGFPENWKDLANITKKVEE